MRSTRESDDMYVIGLLDKDKNESLVMLRNAVDDAMRLMFAPASDLFVL